jgi:hypothetical protein
LHTQENVEQPNGLKSFLKQVGFTISRKNYKEMLDKIRNDNRSLESLTTHSLRSKMARSPRFGRFPDFESIRACAKSVLSTLRSGSGCNCEASHKINLLLENRHCTKVSKRVADAQKLNVVFSYGNSNDLNPWDFRASEIEIVDRQPESPIKEVAGLHLRKKKTVAFLEPEPNEEFEKREIIDPLESEDSVTISSIDDLCGTLEAFWPPRCARPFRGYVCDMRTGSKHMLSSKPIDEQLLEVVSLREVLDNKFGDDATIPRFKKSERKLLAVILASSILQLCETSWTERPVEAGRHCLFAAERAAGLFGSIYLGSPF